MTRVVCIVAAFLFTSSLVAQTSVQRFGSPQEVVDLIETHDSAEAAEGAKRLRLIDPGNEAVCGVGYGFAKIHRLGEWMGKEVIIVDAYFWSCRAQFLIPLMHVDRAWLELDPFF